VFFQPWFIKRTVSIDEEAIVENCVGMYSFLADYLGDVVFRDQFKEKLKERKRARVRETLSFCGDAHPFEQFHRWYCINRGRRHVHLWMHVMSHYIEVILPGIDYDLHNFVMTIPHRYREDGKFYLNLILRVFPTLGDVVWNKTGKPLRLGDPKRSSFVQQHLERAKYAVQRITRGRIDLRNPRSSFDRAFRQNRHFREQVCSLLLDKRATGRGFYDRSGIERLIALELSGRDYGELFESIISVECLFRRFYD
jgi:hypothetical protein